MSITDYVDDIETIARDALFKAGAIELCPIHDDVIMKSGDEDAERHAYALATNVLKADGTIAFMREDVMAAIKDELEQAEGWECPQCGGED